MATTPSSGAAPQNRERAYLPPASPPRNHGHTVAAWVAMSSVMLGAAIVAVGFVVPALWLVWTGAAIAVVGLLVGGLLRRAGLGQPEPTAATRAGAGTDNDSTKEPA